MQIIVIGAGIAGLSAALSLSLSGHRVTLLESARKLAEVGAGIQLTPSATKWLWKWGLGPDIQASAVLPDSFNVWSADDNKLLGKVNFAAFTKKYGGPYLVIHRADLHRVLHDHAVRAGTEVRLNSRVTEYDFEAGTLLLNDGTKMHADLLVAVDGISSNARTQLYNHPDNDHGLQKTGYAAFRLMADVSKVKENPVTEHFVTAQNCNCIAGDGSAIMTYMVKGASKLNMVLTHSDNVDNSSWSQEQFRAEIESVFETYNDTAKVLLQTALSDSSQIITNWPICQVKPLQRWASDSGKFVMLGDAAHAMSYFLSMGTSMAIEDAAALVECLSRLENGQSSVGLAHALSVFEAVRIPRADIVRAASIHSGHVLQLPPGPDRDVRDSALRSDGASTGDIDEFDENNRHFVTTKLSYGVVDQTMREYFYAYDLVEDIQEKWIELVG